MEATQNSELRIQNSEFRSLTQLQDLRSRRDLLELCERSTQRDRTLSSSFNCACLITFEINY